MPLGRPALQLGCRLSPDEVVRLLRNLPSAPRVLPKLKSLLSDANSSFPEVVMLTKLDPGIAARVLQMGNSAFYSHGLRCYTVDEAVNRVGYDQIYGLVANAVASQILIRPLASYGIEADELWRMSVACALAAEALAGLHDINKDIAYTIGLLHGVGMVAIEEWADRQQLGLRFTNQALPSETCEAEKTALGFHNGEVGAALLRLWEFPPVMTEPVRWQYLPHGTTAYFQQSCVLHVAKWIRTSVCMPLVKPILPDAAIMRALNLNRAQLDKITADVQLRLDEVGSLLESSPDGKPQTNSAGGDGNVASQAATRSFINRYA